MLLMIGGYVVNTAVSAGAPRRYPFTKALPGFRPRAGVRRSKPLPAVSNRA